MKGPEEVAAASIIDSVRDMALGDEPTSVGDPGPSSSLYRKHMVAQATPGSTNPLDTRSEEVWYAPYRNEAYDMQHILDLVHDELSEPYNIYTFRFFLDDWPHLSFFAYPPERSSSSDPRPPPIGCIVCKQELHKHTIQRGYIGMLSVQRQWRRKGIARRLIAMAVEAMKANGADEIILETEFDNVPSLALYESLGFVRQKRLYRFYLNGKDAFRLTLPVEKEIQQAERPIQLDSPRPTDSRFFI